MKKGILTSVFLLSIFVKLYCQNSEYDLISQIKKSDSSTTLVYLNALWCKPCMEKLPDVISNFSTNSSIKFIVLFERTGFDKYKNRLVEKYDSSSFRLFPKKYYSTPKGIINISVNMQHKMFKRFLQDYNKELSTNMTTNELWFGHAVILKNTTVYITKNLEKDKMISEIESKIREE